MTILYFTATGNCLQVAKELGGTLLSIPKLVKEEKYEINDDAIGVIFPTYAADAPKMVRRFLEKARLKADYVFCIATYGYLAGAVTRHAQEYMLKAAGHLEYIEKIIMVDNALTLFESKKQIDTLYKKDVSGQIKRVKEEIENRTIKRAKASIFDKSLDFFYHKMGAFHTADKRDMDFTIDENCVKCGICAGVCPAANIILKDKPEYLHHCEGCLACIHNCPKKAIHVKNEKSCNRFRNAEITVGEIEEANNQI